MTRAWPKHGGERRASTLNEMRAIDQALGGRAAYQVAADALGAVAAGGV